MEQVVEVGIQLEKDLIYYHKMLVEKGFDLVYSCVTRDVYYSNQNLNGLSEKEMKDACKRIRYCYVFNKEKKDFENELAQEKQLINEGYKLQFDSTKFDYHYSDGKIKSRIQIQDIENIGLMVYYDNPLYYKYSQNEQRLMLIKELNNYGFNLDANKLGLDKLRTLFYKEEKYSINQNA